MKNNFNQQINHLLMFFKILFLLHWIWNDLKQSVKIITNHTNNKWVAMYSQSIK